MALSKIYIECYPEISAITVTTAKNTDTILPEITQKRYTWERISSTCVVNRIEMIDKLYEAKPDLDYSYFRTLYSIRDLYEPMTWGELGYLLTYSTATLDRDGYEKLDFSTDLPICYKEDANEDIEENLVKYSDYYDMTEYIHEMIEGMRYIPIPLYASYKLLCTKVRLTDDQLFRPLVRKDLKLIDKLLGVL